MTPRTRTVRRSRLHSGIVLFVIGGAALALGFYRFICCSEVQRGVMLVGAVATVAGAAVELLNDWRQRGR